jgi:hypothetical protein
MADRLRNTLPEADIDEDAAELITSLLGIDIPPPIEGEDTELVATLNEGFDTAMDAVHSAILAWLTKRIDD